MRAPRGDQLEEPSSGEGGSQSSGKVGRPNGPAEVSGGPTSPACEQVRAQNQGPRGVPLVGPDSTTVDEGAQGPAHLEGEPAVDSPAVLVGDRGAGRRERRVVHELGPGNPIAGARPLGQQVQSGDEEGVSSGGSEEIHGRRGTDRQRFGGAEGVVRGDAQEGGNPGVRRSGQDAALRGVAAASGREGGASEGASAKGGEVRGRLEWSREEEAAPGENSIEKRSSKEDFEDEEESAAEGQGDRSTRVEVPGGAGSQRAEVGAVNGGPTRQNPIAHFGTKEDWTPVPDSEVESERRRAMAAGGPSESEGGSEEVHFGTQKPVVKQEAGSRSSEPESEEKTDSEAQEPQSQGSAPADTGMTPCVI